MKNSPPTESKTLSVASTLHNMRADVGLTKAGVVSTRSQSQKLISEGSVTVNGSPIKSSYKLQEGDSIEVILEAKPDIDIVPYDFPLDVVYEDEDVLLVNKPAGLVVHPAVGHRDDTLINALMARNTILSEGGAPFRPGLVHRLDKDTSGLLILAKNEEAHNFLAKQFLKKTIHRRYWALCFGSPRFDQGTYDSFLIRDPKNRKRFSTNDEGKGKRAITHYKVLQRSDHFSLLEMALETGRTHQIRVHLSTGDLPIVGDETYNGKKRAKNLKNLNLRKMISEMSRFALHAKELGFVHPSSKKQMMFTSKVAEDLHSLFDLCGIELEEAENPWTFVKNPHDTE